MAPRPPIVQNSPKRFDPQMWKPNTGMDPAKYLVFPGTVRAPGKHSAGNLRHARPYLVNGKQMFIFPIGVEGFRRSGTALLGLHHYIGDNAVDGITVHLEEGRIVLTGTFPGLTAQQNMVELLALLRSPTQNPRGLVLYAPGVFNRQQYLLPESWDFEHTEDDRTHSITYSLTLVKTGEGQRVKDPVGTAAPPNPGRKRKPKGKPSRYFTVNAKHRTLKAISKYVYGNPNKWMQLVNLNKGQLNQFIVKGKNVQVTSHNMPTLRLPLGIRVRY